LYRKGWTVASKTAPRKEATDAAADRIDRPADEAPSAPALLDAIALQFEKLSTAPLEPGLYLVSTPIGNLADISIRGLHALAAADLVLCEDTRHSRKLFSAYGIRRRLESYHDFSGEKDRVRVLSALRATKSVALISDAGTPLVSDPGFKLVRGAIEEGFRVFAVPGASAALAALAPSGLPTDRFFFGGFLPVKESARVETLESCLSLPCTLIFYETPGRIEGTLQALSRLSPDRPAALARELTKLHESFLRGSAAQMLALLQDQPPRGELVLLIGPGEKAPVTEAEIERALRQTLQAKSLKEAVEEVSKGLGVGRKSVYNLALKIREGSA
jgi:16S rRNA (cytidine1402-2'-O)-methyltransferase